MGDMDWARWAILGENSGESEGRYVQHGPAEWYWLARALSRVYRKSQGPSGSPRENGDAEVDSTGGRLSAPRSTAPIAGLLGTCLRIWHVHGPCPQRHAQKFPCQRKKPAGVNRAMPEGAACAGGIWGCNRPCCRGVCGGEAHHRGRMGVRVGVAAAPKGHFG